LPAFDVACPVATFDTDTDFPSPDTGISCANINAMAPRSSSLPNADILRSSTIGTAPEAYSLSTASLPNASGIWRRRHAGASADHGTGVGGRTGGGGDTDAGAKPGR